MRRQRPLARGQAVPHGPLPALVAKYDGWGRQLQAGSGGVLESVEGVTGFVAGCGVVFALVPWWWSVRLAHHAPPAPPRSRPSCSTRTSSGARGQVRRVGAPTPSGIWRCLGVRGGRDRVRGGLRCSVRAGAVVVVGPARSSCAASAPSLEAKLFHTDLFRRSWPSTTGGGANSKRDLAVS